MTGVASSLCSLFLDVPQRDLAPPDVHTQVRTELLLMSTTLCISIHPD